MRGSRGGAGGGSVSGDGKGGSTNGAGMGSIPATSRKMVQSLKEIVNCPELEIYAMLKECNMDPNETVNRLLSQDPFHEVKKKREKKKENKDTTDSRFRGINSNSSRAGRSGADRHSRAATPAPQFGISDTGSSRSSRPSYKKDNGAAYSSAAHGVVENNVNWQPPILSETPFDSKLPTANTSNVTSIHSTPSFQSAWSGVPGQVSMADIVRRGRPHGKAHVSHQITDQHVLGSLQPSPTPNEWRTAQNNSSRVSETVPDSRIGENHAPPSDGWDVDEQSPASNIPYTSEAVADSEPYTAPYDATLDKSNNQPQQPSNELHYMEDGGVDSTQDSRYILDNSQDANDDELYEEMHSYQSHQHERVQQVDDVARDMQQLNLSKEDEEDDEDEEVEDSPRENHSPAVKIPDHLQVQSADCSHLSFGSFGSGMADPFAGPVGSKPAQSDVEGTFAPVEVQPMGHSDASNTEYYGNEDLRDVSDEHVGHGLAANAADGYDIPASSQPETSRQESSEVSTGNEYSFASPSANYGFENNQALDVLSHSQANSHMENLPQQLGATAYPSSLPNNLLASSVQQPREVDHSYSPFPINQSTPDKYGGNVSSISGSAISMTEALKTGSLSHAQLTQNPSSGSNLSGGSGLPQQLAMPSYSQPSVPFAAANMNMMGFPFLPQNYTYMPQSAFQQGFPAGSSSYHQTLAAMLPQYKNSVSVQQSGAGAALASGYGGFGSSSNVPGGNFSLNSSGVNSVAAAPPPPAASSISYEDLLRAQQYKEAAHLLALQQQVQGGPGSRTMSAVPPNTYYGYQGQTQHQQQPQAGGTAVGYRQVQQAPPPQMHSQHYSNLGGYPSNFYAAGNLQLEQHHQQMLREGSQGVQQLQASQVKQQQQPQHQQMWQNNY